ncbi:MAG: DNA polymerase I, partial [Treponema sp.]|nr:DNA polymerase I [Treponema sp.]
MSSFINEDTLFILDSYGLIYREYFAFISRPLLNSKGQNVSAVFGFFRNLLTVIKTYSPKYIVAAMDSKTKTFRHELYPEYKATRPKTPEDLHAQIPIIEDILTDLGIKVLRQDGYEADDIIATLAKKCETKKRHCIILSADKDLQQLTNPYIHCLKPDKTKIWAELDEDGVENEWGVKANRLLDLLSLMGDTADNVPGVKGVGQKTAIKLLSEYDSLEGIYEHENEIKGALGEKIRADRENAFFSKKLITLCTEVPNLCEPENCCCTKLNFSEAARKFTELEIKSIARDYKNEADSIPDDLNIESSVTESSVAPNKGDYKAIVDVAELTGYVNSILNQEPAIVAFDTETDSLDTSKANLLGFSLSFQKGKGVYIPLATTGDLFSVGISKKDATEEIRRLFYNAKCTVIMHNAKFDMKVLDAQGVIKLSDWITGDENQDCSHSVAKIADTMIAAWLLESDRTGKSAYSLEYLSETLLHLKGTEFSDIVPKNGNFADVPLERAAAYSSEDSDFTLQLWQKFEQRLKSENLYKLFFNMEMKTLPILAEMEQNGIHV